MHLEKATNRSSEASVAGWISSNDVTLFTMVLVVVIAIFFHSKLVRGTKENLELTGAKATLTESLSSAGAELDVARDLLDRTSATLHLTQEERDRLAQQLTDKLAEIERLTARLEASLVKTQRLESQRQTLNEVRESLANQRTALVAERDSLVESRDALTADNKSLRERLDDLARQLASKIAALEDVERERERLKLQADELDAIVAGLRQKLEDLNIELTETRTRAAADLEASDGKVEELENRLAAGDKQAEDYLAQLRRATALFQGLRAENAQLQNALTKAEQLRQQALLEEARNNRELVGLAGPLERVAILFDASGSMRQTGPNGNNDRWADAQAIAATWLRHLNVGRCVLIVYSSAVRTFPEDGSLADLAGEQGRATREALLQSLQAVAPAGTTNTLDALRKAYEYDVDTILLFSDGAPSKASSGEFDPAIAEQIYALCRQHATIPINSIGMGNYFDGNMSTFLQTVAKITGGTFRGE